MTDNEKAAIDELGALIKAQPEGLEKSVVNRVLAEHHVPGSSTGWIVKRVGLRLDRSTEVYQLATNNTGVDQAKPASPPTRAKKVEASVLTETENVLTFNNAQIVFESGIVSIKGLVKSVVITLYSS